MRDSLKLIMAFGVAGLGGGVAAALLEANPAQPQMFVAFYYFIAAMSAGFIWVAFNRVVDLGTSKLFFALACIASGVVAGNVLLSFGYYLTSYNPDPTISDHIGASLSCAVGALVYGFFWRWQKT